MAKNGLVFITKATFSAASAVNIDNCFSATYKHYLIVRDFTGSTPDNTIKGNMRGGGVTEVGAAYSHQYYGASATTIYQARNTGYTHMLNSLGYTYGVDEYAEMWVSNPFDAIETTAWSDVAYAAGGSIVQEVVVHCHTLTTSYDGIAFTPNAGTITGTISVFGLVTS